MIDDVRFEISFKDLSGLEKKLKFCTTNKINKINIPCKGTIKKKFFDEAFEYINKNYNEIDIVYHYSLFHQFSKNTDLSYSNLLKFIIKCYCYKNHEILLISGSNKKKNFEVIKVMNYLKKEKIKNLNLGIAYNPYLKNHFNVSDERERFEKKFSTGLISSIWLQFGTDISTLKKEIIFLRKYIKTNGILYKNKSIKIFGSLLIPSRQFISRFRFRPWKEVYISENYLCSLSRFDNFIKELADFYVDNGIHPVIETDFDSHEKLEKIYNLFKS